MRLFRLLKAPAITRLFIEQIRSEELLLVASIGKIMVIFLWSVHVTACIWYAIGRYGWAWGPGGIARSRSWIEEKDIADSLVSDQYTYSFHWALSQFYGENLIEPQNLMERSFAIVFLLVAFVVSAEIIASITSSMTRLQIITSEQSSQFTSLRRYLIENNIGRSLAMRVHRNAQQAIKDRKKHQAEEEITLLQLISAPLLIEVHFELNAKILAEHLFFLNYIDVNPGGMRKVCHTAVSATNLHGGDVLFMDFEVPQIRRMMFIVNGSIQYNPGGWKAPPELLTRPSWLSEACLWTHWTHCGMARVTTDCCQVLNLDAPQFAAIVSKHPSDHASNYAMSFVDWLNTEGLDNRKDTPASAEETLMLVEAAFPEESEWSDSSDEEAPSKVSGITSWRSSGGAPRLSTESRRSGGSKRHSGKTSKRHSMGSRSSRNSKNSSRVKQTASSKLGLGPPKNAKTGSALLTRSQTRRLHRKFTRFQRLRMFLEDAWLQWCWTLRQTRASVMRKLRGEEQMEQVIPGVRLQRQATHA